MQSKGAGIIKDIKKIIVNYKIKKKLISTFELYKKNYSN